MYFPKNFKKCEISFCDPYLTIIMAQKTTLVLSTRKSVVWLLDEGGGGKEQRKLCELLRQVMMHNGVFPSLLMLSSATYKLCAGLFIIPLVNLCCVHRNIDKLEEFYF